MVWKIYKGTNEPHEEISRLGEPPNWRKFSGDPIKPYYLPPEDDMENKEYLKEVFRRLGNPPKPAFNLGGEEVDFINTALYLRRPLFITGSPGIGKSSLAYSIAYELKLGNVLKWSITTSSTLSKGLYHYDAIGRLQETNFVPNKTPPDIGDFIRLGPLGTAFLPFEKPRVLLVDEIDKSDVDLPNDLLSILEEGEFEIPELTRLSKNTEKGQVSIYPYDSDEKISLNLSKQGGHIRCKAFPFIIITSNGERDFPPAFLRRCLRFELKEPNPEKIANIIESHLDRETLIKAQDLVNQFISKRNQPEMLLSTDQLLNAIYLVSRGINLSEPEKKHLLDFLLQNLSYDQQYY